MSLAINVDPSEQGHSSILSLGLTPLPHLDRAKSDIVEDGLVRKQVELLENHADFRPQPGQTLTFLGKRLTIDHDLAIVDSLEPVERST